MDARARASARRSRSNVELCACAAMSMHSLCAMRPCVQFRQSVHVRAGEGQVDIKSIIIIIGYDMNMI